jgi:hypothetical protein
MPRRERWLAREEHARIRDGVAAAGSAHAWMLASKPTCDEVRRRHERLNALAIRHGLAPPYPDAFSDTPECGQ